MALLLHKERVECAMPARMMYAISKMDVFVITDPIGKEQLEKMQKLLTTACIQPMDGLPVNVAKIVAGIIDRVHNKVMARYHGQRADKLATGIYYFIKYLTDSGYLELWEGSPMAEAAAIYLPTIEHIFEIDKVDVSAQKQARGMLKHFQELGYYL